MTTITLTLNPYDRLTLATTIERLINMLDDLEPDTDLEPSLGWNLQGCSLATDTDDREDDRSDDELTCGWSTFGNQGLRCDGTVATERRIWRGTGGPDWDY